MGKGKILGYFLPIHRKLYSYIDGGSSSKIMDPTNISSTAMGHYLQYQLIVQQGITHFGLSRSKWWRRHNKCPLFSALICINPRLKQCNHKHYLLLPLYPPWL